MRLIFTLSIFILLHYVHSQDKSWSWDTQSKPPEEIDHETKFDDYQASPSELVESSAVLNSSLVEKVVDQILSSTREGRSSGAFDEEALKGLDEIYADPNVQDALQKGDEGEARNVIKDRLCYLGLMQCDGLEEVEGKRPHISPEELVYAQPVAINPVGKPIPTIPLKGVRGINYDSSKQGSYSPFSSNHPGSAGNFGPPGHFGPPGKYGPPNKFGPPTSSYPGKPPRRHYGPPLPPSKPFYGKPGLSGEFYAGPEFLSKPPNFVSNSHNEFISPIEPDLPPYKFEQGEHQSAHHKDKRVEITVNAQGGAASSGGGSTSGALEHVHHHYHHNVDGSAKPAIVAAAVSTSDVSSSTSQNSHNSFGSFGSLGALNKPLDTSYGTVSSAGLGSYGSLSNNGNQFNTGSSSTFGNGGLYSGQSLSNYGSSSFGANSFGSVKPVSENYGAQSFNSFGTSVGSYGSSGLYKKELDLNSVNNNFLRPGYGNKYQTSESVASENFDCVCVPHDQCPPQDVIGRKNDLYLPLDPRNLKSDIEAQVDEEPTNSSSTVGQTNSTISEERNGGKKISKRDVEEKKNEKPETRQFNGGFGSLQTCGPRHVCCRRPLHPQIPQLNRQCGMRNSQGINGRIKNPVYVDGDSEFGEYPWQVAILKKDPKESVYVCGGTLIDSLHVITAAHCVKTYTGFDLRVRLGEWDVNHDVEFYPYIERDVGSVHVHPEFYAGTLYNDIAILRMDKPVDWSKQPHISPACLPHPQEDYTGSRCWTTGWGKDAFGDFGKYQNILKEVDVPIINGGVCQRQLQQTRLGYDFKLHPGFICAGGEEGKDACKGDGGGPMVCEKRGTWQVVGVVSWGIGCGQTGVPGVYVKVAHYLDWIRQITQSY